MAESTILVRELGFPEALRWRGDEVWFSDMATRMVVSVAVDGTCRQRAFVPHQPSGLGWRPDGTLLVSSMLDQRVIAIDSAGARRSIADLSGVAIGAGNDMLVDDHGRAYVGSHGFDPAYDWGGSDFVSRVKPAPLVMVSEAGQISIAATDLMCANGMAITADRRRMIVAESAASRLSMFDIEATGELSGRRTLVNLEAVPDGLCIDSEDAVWVALLGAERFVRISARGEVVDELRTPGRIAVDCVLGGIDGRTLFGSVAYTPVNLWSDGQVSSGIEAWRVDVPALGHAAAT